MTIANFVTLNKKALSWIRAIIIIIITTINAVAVAARADMSATHMVLMDPHGNGLFPN